MLEDKEITTFPKSYKFTPYEKNEFSWGLKEKNDLAGVNLKVCKVIILGDLCVGKTSLLNRFCLKIFDTNYRTTIGVDFQSEEIKILGIPYHLQIWDTAGQERFKCIAQCYYRKADVVMLVFDLSSIRTLSNCKNWLRDALDVCENSTQRPYIFLIGSKKDLISKESCKNVEDLAVATAKKLNAEFWTVSAKTGENINDLFFRAAALNFDDDLGRFLREEKEKRVEISNDLISFKKNCKGRTRGQKKCDSFKCVETELN